MTSHNKPRNIYIVGAQSTGKTTLVDALKNYFYMGDVSYEYYGGRISYPKIIKEVARNVLQQHSFTAAEIKSSPTRCLELQKLILQAQLSAERGISDQGQWFVSDRSGVDPIVYARKYVNKDAANVLINSAEWLELWDNMKESLIIVCEAGADWLTDDGVRLMPESRDDWVEFHQSFCNCLDALKLDYEVLPFSVSSVRERVQFVLEKWDFAARKEK